ncbi:right-handed parallel beta-helix repeat-containing protein, partial [Muricoccus roseus]
CPRSRGIRAHHPVEPLPTMPWNHCPPSRGIRNQAQQKGSTSMPFMAEFPSPNPGASSTCDGLSIRGDYKDLNGATWAGIRRCIVKDVVFDAGAHWQTAGGDGGLFIGGVRKARVEGNTFKGSRDVGFYASASDDGVVGGNYVVRNNDFLNCFHGVAMKRGVLGFNISDNYGEGCVRMVTIDYIVASAYGGSVRNNTGKKCHVLARVDQGRNITVQDNLSIEAGAFLADGVTPVAVMSPYIVVLQGAQDCIVVHNNSTGIHPTVAANYPSSGYAYAVSNAQDDATIKSQNNRLINNRATGWRGLGVDQGVNTTMVDNELIGGTVPQFLLGGTGAYEVRVSQATRRRDFSHGINLADGSAALVAVGRRGNDNHGMYFGTNLIGFAIAGVGQFIVDNRGVRLPTIPTYPDDDAAKAAGMVPGNLYKAGDGTLRVVG